MITERQRNFLKALLIEAGDIHPQHLSFRSSAKRLPHGPTMRERSAGFDVWASRLTKKQASEVISFLLEERNRS